MNVYFYAAAGLLAVLIILSVKLFLIKKSAREIRQQLEEKLRDATNTPLVISTADKDMRSLAASLNTELKTLSELRHTYEQGDRAVKKAVTDISHDLRTPLTAISGYLELLKNENKSEQAERYLRIIENRAAAMKELTEELFGFSVAVSSANEPCLVPVDIRSLVEESLAANYTLLTERGITPTVSLPFPMPAVTDRTLLLRVFGNILSNAAKYSDGDLAVTAGEGLSVRFTNRASGLSRVQAEKLFERFYTVSDAGSSTGLGLSIAKELTERLGGSIRAEYTDGVLTITVETENL